MDHIYLDNNSTTQIDPEVFDEMLPYLSNIYGNPSSENYSGRLAYSAIETSRQLISDLINASPGEIIFTSGSTESNNLAIKGIAHKNSNKGRHIVTFKTEQSSVIDCCRTLENQGFEVTYLDVKSDGSIDIPKLKESFRSDTILCIAMHANNEIGVIHPIYKISKLCKEHGIDLFVDATQSVGKIPVDVERLNLDFISFSSHKIYGPKGIGCLYIRDAHKATKLDSQIVGGGQELNYRSGTLNVAGIVGFGKAAQLSMEKLDIESKRILKFRNRIYNTFLKSISPIKLNGSLENRIPGNLNFSFKNVNVTRLMNQLFHQVSISNGSACNSNSIKISHVLQAINSNNNISKSSIRLCIGRFNTDEQISYFIDLIIKLVKEHRK